MATPTSRLESLANAAGFPSPIPPTFTPGQVAKILKLSTPTVLRMMREGIIGCVRVSPRRAWVMPADLEALITSQERPIGGSKP